MKILIGDIGSTKGHWAFLEQEQTMEFETGGYNPVLHESTLLELMLSEVAEKCPEPPDRLYYYGAGVISESVCNEIAAKVWSALGQTEVLCASDLFGAARAVGAGEASIVCILGTGSNSCLFDGEKITEQIPSLGFPLGDEGSGADIGRVCVRAFYYQMMPADLRSTFAQRLPEDRVEFLKQYREHAAPNTFLAELAPLAAEHRESPFMKVILEESFRMFIRLHVSLYGKQLPVHAVGSIATAFHDIFTGVLEKEHQIPGRIIKSPLPGLVLFHQQTDLVS